MRGSGTATFSEQCIYSFGRHEPVDPRQATWAVFSDSPISRSVRFSCETWEKFPSKCDETCIWPAGMALKLERAYGTDAVFSQGAAVGTLKKASGLRSDMA